jgi:hypothetical protein
LKAERSSALWWKGRNRGRAAKEKRRCGNGQLSQRSFSFAAKVGISLSEQTTAEMPRSNPTVVDGLQERCGACNGRALRGLDAHVARMTKPSDTQKEEAVFLQDKRRAVEFQQQRGEPS